MLGKARFILEKPNLNLEMPNGTFGNSISQKQVVISKGRVAHNIAESMISEPSIILENNLYFAVFFRQNPNELNGFVL